MITMRTDYSPKAAPEKQEEDNLRMIQMLLVIAGLSTKELVKYNKANEAVVDLYHETLGEPDKKLEKGGMVHSQERWEAAREAIKPKQAVAEQILITAGITIGNVLDKSDDEQIFSHIITTVYNDYGPNEVARIVRAVVDVESESYEDNMTGYENGR